MSSDDAARSRAVERDGRCGRHEASIDRQSLAHSLGARDHRDAALPSSLTETIAAVAAVLTVEFMAGFQLRDPDGAWRAVQPQTRVPVRVGGATLFIQALHELRDMFERFGRQKDCARVDLIDRLL